MDGTEQALRNNLRDHPLDVGCRAALIDFLIEQGDEQKIEAAYRQWLQTDPCNTDARGNYAQWLGQQGRIEEFHRQRIAAEPDNDALRLEYADWLDKNVGTKDDPGPGWPALTLEDEKGGLGNEGGSAYAAFIRHEVSAARTDDASEKQRLTGLAIAILHAHDQGWKRSFWPEGHNFPERLYFNYERGMPVGLICDDQTFLSHGKAIFDLAPTLHELTYQQIGNAGVIALADNPLVARLDTLVLDSNQISDEGVMALADSPHIANLRALRLRNNRIGQDGLRSLASSPHVAELQLLDLSQNEIENAGAAALAGGPHLAKLHTLNLRHNRIGDSGAGTLLGSPQLSNIHALDLSCNQIGNAGAVALARNPHLTNLQNLGLFSNYIGDDGVRALADSPHLANLRSLNLENQVFGHDCISQITDVGLLDLANGSHFAPEMRIATIGFRGKFADFQRQQGVRPNERSPGDGPERRINRDEGERERGGR